MGWICLDLGRLCYVENTPFEVPGEWERVLSDLFSWLRRLDIPIFLWGAIV
jgi:hypothetical protein